jgi:hypothetical protein
MTSDEVALSLRQELRHMYLWYDMLSRAHLFGKANSKACSTSRNLRASLGSVKQACLLQKAVCKVRAWR